MLPHLFAVMHTDTSLPSRYYLHITYQHHHLDTVIVVNNIQVNKLLSISISHSEETEPYKTTVSYLNAQYNLTCWNTGIYIISEENERIPVLDFNTHVFLPNGTNRPSPVYITPDSIIAKSQHQIILRQRRNQMMDLLIEELYSDIHTAPPPPPAIQRVHQHVDNELQLGTFSLPPHAAAMFVRALIQENKTCCITTNTFNEIDVVGITPCFHCFDCEALETWLFSHTTCPECRSSVTCIAKYKR